MTNEIYTLQSGQKLNSAKFCRYLGRKIEKTGNKLDKISNSNSIYCLDDAAVDIIYSLMTKKQAKIKQTQYLYCLKKELELYSKLRKLKLKFIKYSGLKLKIKEMLDTLEEKHKEIKYSILKAFLQTLDNNQK